MSVTFTSMDHALDDKATKQDALIDNESVNSTLDDDRVLQEIGYVPSFKREFSNLATVRSFSLHLLLPGSSQSD